MIRQVKLSDASDICSIYNEYITNSRITFEEIPVTEVEIKDRIQKVTEQYPWLVYESEGKVTGYTYASKWKERAAYCHSVEITIYLSSNQLKMGIGSKLMDNLLKELKQRSVHCVISGIALPNPASIALCEKFGFKKVAHFKEIGYKLNQWVDVGYWELIL